MQEIKILLSGAMGRLGRAIVEAAGESECRIVAGIDINQAAGEIPIYQSPSDVPSSLEIDCVIDCSHHTAIGPLLEFAIGRGLPVVVCTTGHTEEETAMIHSAAEQIPVFFSRNMSVGINLLIKLAKQAAEVLGRDFDVEIIERHHNRKLDAPSGTALMIADAVAPILGDDTVYTYERQSRREARRKNEIGIHSVRGGTIVGEHEIMFAGADEVITIQHSAASRDVFARGALRAARYMTGKPNGFYNMETLVDGN